MRALRPTLSRDGKVYALLLYSNHLGREIALREVGSSLLFNARSLLY